MIYPSLDALEEAMKMKDGKKFGAAIENLRNTCNACHSAEKVLYIHVQFPLQRLSPIKFSETNATLDYFTDFKKIKSNVNKISIKLNQLNYLMVLLF